MAITSGGRIYKPFLDALANALAGTSFVISGCTPTAGTGLVTAVAAGSAIVNGTLTTVVQTNVTHAAVVAAGASRVDIVYIASGSSTPVYAAGVEVVPVSG